MTRCDCSNSQTAAPRPRTTAASTPPRPSTWRCVRPTTFGSRTSSSGKPGCLSDHAIDVLFGRARYFGLREGDHPHPEVEGLLERSAFLRAMYAADLIAAPTAVVRRELHQRLGRFDESLPSEDYEFWLRALSAGASFYYDSRLVTHLRQHGANVSMRALEIWEMNHRLRREFAPAIGDGSLSRKLLARDLTVIARCRFGAGMVAPARAAYLAALRQRPSAEAATGAALLSIPGLGEALGWLNARRPRRAAG